MRIFRDAKRLVNLAYSSRDPEGFVRRWLAQDFNEFDAAAAILALEEITGVRWMHPDTATPTPMQIVKRPALWTKALRIIEAAEAHTVLESQCHDIAPTWSPRNGVNRRAFDIERKGTRPEIRRQKSKNEKPYAFWS